MSENTNVTAREVREWFAKHQSKVPAGDKSVGTDSKGRGRLSPEAIKVYETATKNTYEQGHAPAKTREMTLSVPMRDKNGRNRPSKSVTLTVSEVRKLAGNTATRGRISAADKAKAAEAYAEQLKAENAGKARKSRTKKTAESKPAETPEATQSEQPAESEQTQTV